MALDLARNDLPRVKLVKLGFSFGSTLRRPTRCDVLLLVCGRTLRIFRSRSGIACRRTIDLAAPCIYRARLRALSSRLALPSLYVSRTTGATSNRAARSGTRGTNSTGSQVFSNRSLEVRNDTHALPRGWRNRSRRDESR